MSKREHITIIKPWKITTGEHAGKWLGGVQWIEGTKQKDRQIDRPRSTHHEAQRDADTLARKIEVEGMQGDYPPLVTTQAREEADAAEIRGIRLDHEHRTRALQEAIEQRNAAEQQISDAIEALHAHGIPVEDGMVASVTALAKAWRLLSETHNKAIQEAMEAQAKAEKERDEAVAQAEETSDLGSLRDLIIKEKQAWREAETSRVEGHLMRSRAKEAASRLRAEEMHRRAQRAEGLIRKLRAAADAYGLPDA